MTITDEAAAIARQLRESLRVADVVILTGGLGPTCDDRTREAVADVLGLKLVFDPAIEKTIADRFVLFGRKMTPNNLKQAYRFDQGEVLPNANGTAPGLWVEKGRQVRLPSARARRTSCSRCSPPRCCPGWRRSALLRSDEAYVQIRTAGVGESLLETKLQPIFERVGDSLSIAFCAHAGHVDCRLSSPDGRLGPERAAGRGRGVRPAPGR